jgi:LPS export ABC transporter protein LptC
LNIARAVFFCCLVVAVAALFFGPIPSQRPTEEGEGTAGIETEEDIVVEGIGFSEWEEDRLVWTMEAERSWYRHAEEKARLEQVEVTFFPPGGGRMLLWATFVDYDVQTRDLWARESVRGRSDQGYDFTTESLLYDADEREVKTDDKVTLEKDRLTIQGTGMKGSLAEHRFHLLSAVRAEFAPQMTVPGGAIRQ